METVKENISFAMAQYKYKCHMYDVYEMSNVEYPCKHKSYMDERGSWILIDYLDCYLCKVTASGKVFY